MVCHIMSHNITESHDNYMSCLKCIIFIDYSSPKAQASLASDAARIVESDSFISTCRSVFSRHLHTHNMKLAANTCTPRLQQISSIDHTKSQVKIQRPLRVQLNGHSTHVSLADDEFDSIHKQTSFSSTISNNVSVHEIKVTTPTLTPTDENQSVTTAEVRNILC